MLLSLYGEIKIFDFREKLVTFSGNFLTGPLKVYSALPLLRNNNLATAASVVRRKYYWAWRIRPICNSNLGSEFASLFSFDVYWTSSGCFRLPRIMPKNLQEFLIARLFSEYLGP